MCYNEQLSNHQDFEDSFETGFPGFHNKIPLGICGDRTQHLLFRVLNGEILNCAGKSVIKNVIVHIGVNNINAGDSWESVFEGIKAIVAALTGFEHIERVFFVPILPPHPNAVDKIREINATNEAVKRWITEEQNKLGDRVGVIDCGWNLFYGKKNLMPDYLHLNAEGYLLWAKCISETIGNFQLP